MWSLRLGERCSASVRSSKISNINRITGRRLGFRAIARGPAQHPVVSAAREPASYDALWDEFASKVQGEWEGVTVTFNAEGVAQPLPERFVPGAYREWGVELWDWQSQSSCCLQGEGQGGERSLRNIFKRLMPTVGCEADAIAYVEEAEDVWKADGGSLIKPVTADGGYVAAPAQLPEQGGKMKLEACLAAPGGRSRLRATLTLMQHWETKEWQVAFVDLSRETYDGPFNGGVELSGCAGGGKPFAKDPVITAQQLAGPWSVSDVYNYARNDSTGGLQLQAGADKSDAVSAASTRGASIILLPLGAWVSCAASKSNVRVEVGALRGDSERDVAVCRYTEGNLAEVALVREKK